MLQGCSPGPDELVQGLMSYALSHRSDRSSVSTRAASQSSPSPESSHSGVPDASLP